MWTLKDVKLKQKLNVWFTDEEIDSEYCQQMHTLESVITLRKDLSPAAGSVVFDIFKNEFELTYNPNGWNPYPQVTPPNEGEWLVQDKYGDLTIREFHATYGPEGCDKWWENTPSYYPEAVAFRALPEPYTGNKK